MRDTTDALAVRHLIYGRLVSDAVCAFAALGLAERIGESGCSATELASSADLHPGRLADLLRLLAAYDLVRFDGELVRLTARGRCLRAAHPASALPTALLVREVVGPAWGALEITLRTGRPAFDAVYGRSFFAEIDSDPALRAVFDESQARGAESDLGAVMARVAGRGHVVDLGGGDGYLLARLLTEFPALTGTLVDRPAAVERARERMRDNGLASRCDCVVGDFFAPLDLALGAGELLILRHICHDWDDDACVALLTRCRAALGPGARLLVVEHHQPDPDADIDPTAALMSLYMATVTSGRERTLAEYEKLLGAAGLTVLDSSAAGGVCVIEAGADR
ncbi:methyltransferase [Nocardia sp. NPDC003482]